MICCHYLCFRYCVVFEVDKAMKSCINDKDTDELSRSKNEILNFSFNQNRVFKLERIKYHFYIGGIDWVTIEQIDIGQEKKITILVSNANRDHVHKMCLHLYFFFLLHVHFNLIWSCSNCSFDLNVGDNLTHCRNLRSYK
jgi:hypothetical protein